MFTSRLSRYIALSGVVAYLLLLVFNDVVNGDQPKYDADPAVWASYIADHNGPANHAMFFVELLGLSLAGVFLAIVCALLRRAEGDRGFLASVALFSGAVGIAVKVGFAAPFLTAVYLSDKGLSDELVRALINVNGAAFALSFIPYGVMMLALGAGILSYRHLPTWLGWLGIVTGVALIAGAPFLDDDGPGFIGMLLFILWNMAASLTLFVKWPSIVPAATARPEGTRSEQSPAGTPAI